MSASALVELPTCPVCADPMDGPVRTCERCGTPHHPECWDYVPGCAVFGCVDTAPALATESWPRVHQLVLSRARGAAVAAGAFQASVGIFALAATLDIPPSVIPHWLATTLLTASALAMAVGVLATVLFFVRLVQMRLAGGAELLRQARADGDRRLRAAIESRVGSLAPGAQVRYLTTLGVTIAGSQMLKQVWTGGLQGPAHLVGLILATGILGCVYAAVLSPPLLIGGVLVGSQRVLANRMAAALPEKPAPPQLEAGAS